MADATCVQFDRARHLVQSGAKQVERLTSLLNNERRRNEGLEEELKKARTQIVHLQRIIADGTGGIQFECFNQRGIDMTHIRSEVCGDSKYEVAVELLTAVLQEEGVLEKVLMKSGEYEDPPSYSFKAPALANPKRDPLRLRFQGALDLNKWEREKEKLRKREEEIERKEAKIKVRVVSNNARVNC